MASSSCCSKGQSAPAVLMKASMNSQVVEIDGEILEKPADTSDAIRMLTQYVSGSSRLELPATSIEFVPTSADASLPAAGSAAGSIWCTRAWS